VAVELVEPEDELLSVTELLDAVADVLLGSVLDVLALDTLVLASCLLALRVEDDADVSDLLDSASMEELRDFEAETVSVKVLGLVSVRVVDSISVDVTALVFVYVLGLQQLDHVSELATISVP
jgi:hypothetical protein